MMKVNITDGKRYFLQIANEHHTVKTFGPTSTVHSLDKLNIRCYSQNKHSFTLPLQMVCKAASRYLSVNKAQRGLLDHP